MTQQQWCTFELSVETQQTYCNPFQDVDVVAHFTGPNGETLTRLAFWDGDGTWRIRVALTSVGPWSYTIASSDGNTDFAAEGSVTCVPYEGDLDIYKHGFPRLGPQNRYFVYDDGTPFFWLGDTHWTFVTEERWDESNCSKYESQFRACVDKRVAQRFTVYESNFRDAKDFHLFGRYDKYLVETENGLMPNIPFLQSNPDPKMKYIADVGLVNAIGFTWGMAMLGEGNRERYVLLAKYLVARYGSYPIIWTLGGELSGFGTMAEDWRQVALETEKWDTYEHLMTFHQAAIHPFLETYIGESWYDFAMTQGAHGDAALYQDMYAEFRHKHPCYPIVEGECLYEGALSNEPYSREITAMMMRSIAWQCFQTGGCGYTYGCNGVWELQWESGVGGIGWGDMAWWEGLELPGANHLTLMRDFYEHVKWWTLKPAQSMTEVRSFTKDSGVMTSANDDMSTVVVYFMPMANKTCTLRGLAHCSYTARWFDPETGAYTLIDDDIRPGRSNTWHVPPMEKPFQRIRHDFVLLLTAN